MLMRLKNSDIPLSEHMGFFIKLIFEYWHSYEQFIYNLHLYCKVFRFISTFYSKSFLRVFIISCYYFKKYLNTTLLEMFGNLQNKYFQVLIFLCIHVFTDYFSENCYVRIIKFIIIKY